MAPRQRTLLLVLVAVLAIAVAVLRDCGYLGGHTSDGPLATIGSTVTSGVKPGHQVLIGMAPVFADAGSGPLTIESAELVGPGPADGVDVGVVYYPTPQHISGEFGRLPAGWKLPAGGKLAPAGPTGDLVAQILPKRRGVFTFEGVRLRYKRGGRRFEQRVGVRAVICATAGGKPCPEPDDEDAGGGDGGGSTDDAS